MAGINRVGSPMDLVDDSIERTKATLEEKKRSIEQTQRAKSPFLIGSIEEVNRKISRLDHKLQQYTQLIVESRASGYSDDDVLSRPKSSVGRNIIERKEREQKELNKFAGYFTLKQKSSCPRELVFANIMDPDKTAKSTREDRDSASH